MLQQIYPSPTHGYRYELNKDFQFAAAHYVPHPDAGVCQQVHGHTYFVNITVAGDELDDAGFLVNFKDLKDAIHGRFDHKLLNGDALFNDEVSELIPTTENVARVIWEVIQDLLDRLPQSPKCLQVLVRETPTSYVVYRPKEVR